MDFILNIIHVDICDCFFVKSTMVFFIVMYLIKQKITKLLILAKTSSKFYKHNG